LSLRAGRYLFVAAAVLFAACKPSRDGAQGPTRPVAEWTGEEKQLFDDGIDVGAFPLGDAPPSRDESNEALIPRRMDAADAVVLAKVIGVHAEPIGDKRRYRLEVTVEGDPLYAANAPPSTFSMNFSPESTAYGTVRALEARLIGRKLVVFFRQYAGDEGSDAIVHFHVSPPSKAVLEAIELHKTRKQFD
jgi:hypothetical protein